MYIYDELDQRAVNERVEQFRGQIQRRLSGALTEDEFKPLRLQNGLYMQLHAYMFRIAVPYGLLTSTKVRALAHIARTYDKGYAHLTTRQNVQLNWPKLADIPTILDELAKVQMHAIQTSGNCIRNVSSDPFAGVAKDELEDPRPYCELLRQWSTFHPEFAFLPRKFKLAVTGATRDRAAVAFHDIGLKLVKGDAGEIGFEVLVGGGMGRTPFVASVCREFLPKTHLLGYVEAILRVYNRYGRRDNKFKARIKILVDALGIEEFSRLVEEEFSHLKGSELDLPAAELERVQKHFIPAEYETLSGSETQLQKLALGKNRPLGQWVNSNVTPHQQPGYSIVTVSVKEKGTPPGDVSDTQLDRIADLADKYSLGRVTVTHTQNLVLPDVKTADLEALHTELTALGLATANAEKLTDMICCPGLDYCGLANASSIPIALEISDRFDDVDYLNDVGDVSLKISGCINACGHHHVGNIGILGIDKGGVEFYQLSLGGSAFEDAALGKVVGAALPKTQIVDAVEQVLTEYLKQRESPEENFLATYRRVGAEPFKTAIYGDSVSQATATRKRHDADQHP